MRTQGSLRVILNTMIYSGMLVDKASPKSIQISAVDGEDGVKIFLINVCMQFYLIVIINLLIIKWLLWCHERDVPKRQLTLKVKLLWKL